MQIGALILAAGKGTRLYSTSPKVLHKILGISMLWYVFDALEKANITEKFTVVGFGRDEIERTFPEEKDSFIVQDQQLGTGHAVQIAWSKLEKFDYVFVVNGDTPLLPASSLQALQNLVKNVSPDLAFLSIKLDNPAGYGRVVRKQDGELKQIVEAKDCTEEEFKIREVNSGIYILKTKSIGELLPLLSNENQQKEFYITQLVELAKAKGLKVLAHHYDAKEALLGINTAEELVVSEEIKRAQIVDNWLKKGVILRNNSQIRISPKTVIEPGVQITGPAEIYGKTILKANTIISSHCVIVDSFLDGCEIHSFSHLEKAIVNKNAVIGPYARLRPGAQLGEHSKVGNFVEIKKSNIGKNTKISHLSYIGDTEIGQDANIGAGTITCNYDGKNKHRTIIGDRAFVGSNTALVAPVNIGADSLIGAGSVITQNVESEHLGLARAKQTNYHYLVKNKKSD